jgi:hypothetical protein
MVNVPAISPFDTFRDPFVGIDFGYPDQYASKSQQQKSSVNSKPKGEKFVDVLVPQSPGQKLYNDNKQQQQVPRPVQDDCVVPEFKAPAAVAPQTYDCMPEVGLRQAPAVPADLNFLDLDDWTSPFDLGLDFENIVSEWDDQSVFGSSLPDMPRQQQRPSSHYAVPHQEYSPLSLDSPVPSSEVSCVSASSEEEASAAQQEETQPVEEDEFTRNRRLCLERYREKKRNRRFSKKVRYHLRKMNADRRPRYKGRFIKKGEVIPKELLDKPSTAN